MIFSVPEYAGHLMMEDTIMQGFALGIVGAIIVLIIMWRNR